ncbi:glycosyltransferase [Corynebacterium pseudokroppenstedtii]|nr:glycosyltransferase [Corynebacterium pseudokroppenstedtii]MDK7148445.1 glycosyltransferase [Corynebacterium pseudokroppenstedtii]
MTFHALYTSKSKNPTIETGSFAPTAQPSQLSAVAAGDSVGETRSAVSTLNSRALSENAPVTGEKVPVAQENTPVAPGDSAQGDAESYHPTDPRQATVEIVIPVYNEATSLPTSIPHLVESLSNLVPFTTTVTIADNASIDNTWIVAGELERQLPSVRRVHLDQKGRGRMLKKVWLESQCDVVAYIDVDLSTDLHALLPLLAPLVSDHSDIAIGSRLARSANVVRGSKREFISRTYNHMLRLMMSAHFSDAQCGFKAMRTDVARAILPHVEDPNWFFDTEVLLLAEKAGYRIHEVPVDWTDDPDSRVNVVETALQDLRGMWRVRRNIASHRINLDSFRRSSRTSEPPVLEGVRGRPEPQQSFLGMSGDSALSELPRR